MSSKAKGLGKTVRQKRERGSNTGNVDVAREAAIDRSEEDTKRLNVDVPETLYKQFRATCKAEGRSISWVVRQMLEGYVSNTE